MERTSPVLLDIADGIAHVTLNRPRAGNVLDIEMADGLNAAFSTIEGADSVKVVRLGANGKLFCGGGDLRSMHEAADPRESMRRLVDAAHAAVRRIAAIDKPLVTAVQGPAAGAGLSLVLLSDVVLAASTAVFTTAYTAVGLTPDCGQSWLLPRMIGLGRASALTLMPDRITADHGATIGIVTRVVEPEALAAEAESLAVRLATGPADALGDARHLLRSGLTQGLDAHLDLEADTIVRRAGSSEAAALISAFYSSKT